jgi:hypothetical protein
MRIIAIKWWWYCWLCLLALDIQDAHGLEHDTTCQACVICEGIVEFWRNCIFYCWRLDEYFYLVDIHHGSIKCVEISIAPECRAPFSLKQFSDLV